MCWPWSVCSQVDVDPTGWVRLLHDSARLAGSNTHTATHTHTHTPCCSYGRTSRCDCNEMKRARIDSVHEVSALFSCWNMTRLCPKATREVTRRLSFRPSSSRVKRSGYRIQRAACTACGPSCRQSLRQNESEVTAGDVDTSEYVLPLPISLCL